MGEAEAAQGADQDVGERNEPEPQLVGAHGGGGRSVGEEIALTFLDTVLHLAARAVDVFVEEAGVSFDARQRSDDEARVGLRARPLRLTDNAASARPGVERRVAEILEAASRLARALRLLLGMAEFDVDFLFEPLVARQAEHEVIAVLLAPRHQAFTGETGIGAQQDAGSRPALADLRDDPRDLLFRPGAQEEVARIVAQIRERWPRVRILLRGDSGFCRDELMSWCETNRVDFLFGLARNSRLVGEIGAELVQVEAEARQTGKPARRFKDFSYSTLDSWSRRRRVVGKAEWTNGEANPRFVVTTLKPIEQGPRELYEDVYCARGDIENRIKESQADLFADRTSTATMKANQLRLWFSSFAYVLVCAVRRIGLRHTQFADATAGTIRLKLFKIGALVKVSARRIKFALPTACPYANEWRLAAAYLARAAPV